MLRAVLHEERALKQNQPGLLPMERPAPLRRLSLGMLLTRGVVCCSGVSLAQTVIGPIGPTNPGTPSTKRPATTTEAPRFLTHATVRPTGSDTGSDIGTMMRYGCTGRLDPQFALPATTLDIFPNLAKFDPRARNLGFLNA